MNKTLMLMLLDFLYLTIEERVEFMCIILEYNMEVPEWERGEIMEELWKDRIKNKLHADYLRNQVEQHTGAWYHTSDQGSRLANIRLTIKRLENQK